MVKLDLLSLCHMIYVISISIVEARDNLNKITSRHLLLSNDFKKVFPAQSYSYNDDELSYVYAHVVSSPPSHRVALDAGKVILRPLLSLLSSVTM